MEKSNKYSLVEWPDIQYYMDKSWFDDESYFDPVADVWFIPYEREEDIEIIWNEKDIGNLNDVMG